LSIYARNPADEMMYKEPVNESMKANLDSLIPFLKIP
jgi:hypothetical protein